MSKAWTKSAWSIGSTTKIVAIIVYDTDCKEKTIEFFDTDIPALRYKAQLEAQGADVTYVDIPTISVLDAELLYEAIG